MRKFVSHTREMISKISHISKTFIKYSALNNLSPLGQCDMSYFMNINR